MTPPLGVLESRVRAEFGPRAVLRALISWQGNRALLRRPPRAVREARFARHLDGIRRDEGWLTDLDEADDAGRPL